MAKFFIRKRTELGPGTKGFNWGKSEEGPWLSDSVDNR